MQGSIGCCIYLCKSFPLAHAPGAEGSVVLVVVAGGSEGGIMMSWRSFSGRNSALSLLGYLG